MKVTNDITELVKADHRRVEGIFHQMEGADLNLKNSLFLQLRQELDLHLTAEEEVMYPRTEAYAELEDLTRDSLEEHQEVRSLLEHISSLSPEESEWNELVLELKECIQHHVEDEENKLFPEMKDLLGEEELVRLGHNFEHSKFGMKLAV